MWALRAQTDKVEYAQVMRRVLEATPNLSLREVCDCVCVCVWMGMYVCVSICAQFSVCI